MAALEKFCARCLPCGNVELRFCEKNRKLKIGPTTWESDFLAALGKKKSCDRALGRSRSCKTNRNIQNASTSIRIGVFRRFCKNAARSCARLPSGEYAFSRKSGTAEMRLPVYESVFFVGSEKNRRAAAPFYPSGSTHFQEKAEQPKCGYQYTNWCLLF